MDAQFAIDEYVEVVDPLAGLEVDRSICLNNRRQSVKTTSTLLSTKSKLKTVCSKSRAVLLLVLVMVVLISILLAVLSQTIDSSVRTFVGHNDSTATDTSVNKSSGLECDVEFPWGSVRLPTTFEPVQYTLYLNPHLDTGLFLGNVTIDVNTTENDVKWVVLHSKFLTIDRFSVKSSGIGDDAAEIPPSLWRFCPKTDQVAFAMPTKFDRGQLASLFVEFHGNITDKLEGLYKSSYVDKSDGTTHKLAVTQLEPVYARQMLPCFDEPSFKANFLVTVAHEPGYFALGNTPLSSSVTVETSDGKPLIVDTFKKTLKMSTYLLAIVVSDYLSKSANSSSGVLVSVYAPAYQINQIDWALNVSVRALEYLESFFGVPYPLKKLDLISINDFQAGAMENWGLITFRDSLFLYDSEKSTIRSREFIASVIVHEISHQWFGNLVTMKWWSDLWLNEGFADFMQIFITGELHPNWHLMSTFVSSNLAEAQALDGLVHTHAVSSNISDPAEIESVFDAISYNKGSSLIRSLMNLVGLDNLKLALREYLSTYKYSNAQRIDLWHILNKHSAGMQSDVSVENFMNSFTECPGYPLIETSVQNGKLYASQSRFFFSLNPAIDDVKRQEQLWYVPLTIKTAASKEITLHWMKNEGKVTVNINVPDSSWYKVNVDKNGFFRVNYEPENWLALFKAMAENPEVLSAQDRAGLLDDAFALLKLGKVKSAWLLDLLEKYLSKETSRGCWNVINENLMDIENLLRESEVYSKFKGFVAKILSPIYRQTSWDLQLSDYESIFVHKTAIKLSCMFDVDGCREKAASSFMAHISNGTKILADFRSSLCGYAIRIDPNSMFDRVFKLYNDSEVPSEKLDYLSCLAQTNSYWHLNRLMSLTLDPYTVKGSLIATVLDSMSTYNTFGSLLAWKFFQQDYKRIREIVQLTTMAKIIKVFDSLHTQLEYDQMTDFFKNEDLQSGKPAYEQTREKIQINIQFLRINEPDLILYFKNK